MMNVIITIIAMGIAFVGGIAWGYKALLIKAREKMLPKDFLEFREKIEKIMEQGVDKTPTIPYNSIIK